MARYYSVVQGGIPFICQFAEFQNRIVRERVTVGTSTQGKREQSPDQEKSYQKLKGHHRLLQWGGGRVDLQVPTKEYGILAKHIAKLATTSIENVQFVKRVATTNQREGHLGLLSMPRNKFGNSHDYRRFPVWRADID